MEGFGGFFTNPSSFEGKMFFLLKRVVHPFTVILAVMEDVDILDIYSMSSFPPRNGSGQITLFKVIFQGSHFFTEIADG